MSTQTLSDILTPVAQEPGSFAFEVPVGWGQGKATFGGLVVGACVRAALLQHDTASGQTLRSLSAQLVGAPQPGPTSLRVVPMKKTKTTTMVGISLSQGGELMTHVVAVFGAPRAMELNLPGLTPPTLPDWRQLEVLDMSVSFAPEFSRNFEYRLVDGIPFTGSAPRTSGFIWPRHAGERLDEAVVTALADTWWLAAFVGFEGPRPAATLSFTLDFHHPLTPLEPGAPVFHRAEVTHLHQGYCSETRELWSLDGRLLALNHQTIAIVK